MTDDSGSYPPLDTFERWLHEPLQTTSPDPRFDVCRARPQDFDRIYDLVDEIFGVKRPRAGYSWASGSSCPATTTGCSSFAGSSDRQQ